MGVPQRTTRQLLTFMAVGAGGTAAYAGLYVLWHGWGWWGTALAWLVSTVATNVVHRRLTYGVRARARAGIDAAVQLISGLVGLGVSTWLIGLGDDKGMGWAIAMLVLGTFLGGVVRFVAMRAWFDRRS